MEDFAKTGQSNRLSRKKKVKKIYETFDDFNLQEGLLKGIEDYGYCKPSAVQQKALVPLFDRCDVIVEGESNPEKRFTLCLGVLQLLDFEGVKLQAIVVTSSNDSALEIGKDMEELGKFLPVKVHVIGLSSCPTPLEAHVLVGTASLVWNLLMERVVTSRYVKMVVLDEPDYMKLGEIYAIFFRLYCQPQIVAFSKFGLDMDFKELLKSPKLFTVNEPDELTFSGIRKHYVIRANVDESLKTEQLKELFKPTKQTSVVFVNSLDTGLVEKMRKIVFKKGWEVCYTYQNMNKKSRDQITQFLSQSDNRVLITTEAWASGIDFQHVSLVVNYDMPKGDESNYLGRMGLFREVYAFNFVAGEDWHMLFGIQMRYEDVFFKASKLGPWDNRGILNEELPNCNEGIRFSLLEVEERSEGRILSELRELVVDTKSVVFVNTSNEVTLLREKIIQGFIWFKVFTNVQEFSQYDHRCMLITSDEDGVLPEEVPLVINFHQPLATLSYERRIGCCKKKGNVVFYVTDQHDWSKVFDVQRLYGCKFCQVPRDVADLVDPLVTLEE